MAFVRNLAAGGLILAAVILAGCDGPGSAALGDSGTAFDKAAADEKAVFDDVQAVFVVDGLTDSANLPTGDDLIYSGSIRGATGGGSGPDLIYYADLTLTVNLDGIGGGTVGGTIDNVHTNLPGFASPNGSATISGSVDASRGIALLSFSTSGLDELTSGTGTTATYDFQSTSGVFYGADGEAAYGTQTTDFIWTAGPNIGTSRSDGHWSVIQ